MYRHENNDVKRYTLSTPLDFKPAAKFYQI